MRLMPSWQLSQCNVSYAKPVHSVLPWDLLQCLLSQLQLVRAQHIFRQPWRNQLLLLPSRDKCSLCWGCELQQRFTICLLQCCIDALCNLQWDACSDTLSDLKRITQSNGQPHSLSHQQRHTHAFSHQHYLLHLHTIQHCLLHLHAIQHSLPYSLCEPSTLVLPAAPRGLLLHFL